MASANVSIECTVNIPESIILATLLDRLDKLEAHQRYDSAAIIDSLHSISKKVDKVNATVDSLNLEIQTLTQDVADGTTVSNSAVVLLNGISAQIAAAVATAQAAGATPDQLSALSALSTSITTQTSTLAAAVAANTPAAPSA